MLVALCMYKCKMTVCVLTCLHSHARRSILRIQHALRVQSQAFRSADLHSTLCVYRPAQDRAILEDSLNASRHEPNKQYHQLAAAELRKDFVKKAPGPVAEAAAPIRSLAPPPTNMAQANNARGEGKVNTLALPFIWVQADSWLINET